jgi:fused signal recognition particle receptor
MKLFNKINIDKLKEGLSKTRNNLLNKLSETINRKAKFDNETIEELENILIDCDLGIDLTENIINNVRNKILSSSDRTIEKVKELIKEELVAIIGKADDHFTESYEYKPYVILVIGVNGSGKTTTIGKLANIFHENGYKVIIGSADTFRAGANEQLKIWSERADVDIIEGDSSSDPASIAYETVKTALEKKHDIVLIDTAGRLHNNKNLMLELTKVHKVLGKLLAYAPNETFLVIDGTTGQNALQQAYDFNKTIKVSGLIVTKLDGTAKGGMIFRICADNKIPVKYIGVGEMIDDLQSFDINSYVQVLFN